MLEEQTNIKLGKILKDLLEENLLSMRKLSKLTGIETATISRIINGKQPAKPKHLQQFAKVLGVPIERLFEAAGYGIREQKEALLLNSDFHTSIETIQNILSSSNLFDEQYTKERVEQKLIDYEHYAQTEEGHRIILEGYQEKIKQVGGLGPFINDLNKLYKLYCECDTTPTKRAILGSALLYFISATDIIPDYVFPIGYLDDAIAIKHVLHKLSLMEDSIEEK